MDYYFARCFEGCRKGQRCGSDTDYELTARSAEHRRALWTDSLILGIGPNWTSIELSSRRNLCSEKAASALSYRGAPISHFLRDRARTRLNLDLVSTESSYKILLTFADYRRGPKRPIRANRSQYKRNPSHSKHNSHIIADHSPDVRSLGSTAVDPEPAFIATSSPNGKKSLREVTWPLASVMTRGLPK